MLRRRAYADATMDQIGAIFSAQTFWCFSNDSGYYRGGNPSVAIPAEYGSAPGLTRRPIQGLYRCWTSNAANAIERLCVRIPPLLKIRSAVPEDEQTLIALWRACDLVASYNDPAADLRFAKAGACSDVLVGEDQTGQIKGSVMVGHDGHRGWLYYLASDPGSRGRGFGRQMVQAAEEWLRQRGVVKAQLLVREANTKVVSFYEHLGFEVAPRTVMSKWLK